jgi:hypothetical protein
MRMQYISRMRMQTVNYFENANANSILPPPLRPRRRRPLRPRRPCSTAPLRPRRPCSTAPRERKTQRMQTKEFRNNDNRCVAII